MATAETTKNSEMSISTTMSGALQGLAGLQSVINDLTFMLASFAKTIASITLAGGELAAAILDIADKTGISTDALQAWADAAQKAGVNAAAVLKDIANKGQKGLLDIAEEMKDESPDQALEIGRKHGLSDDTSRMLYNSGGQEGVEKSLKQSSNSSAILPQDQLESIVKGRKGLQDLENTAKNVAKNVSGSVSGMVNEIVQSINEWSKANENLIAQNLGEVAKGFVEGFKNFRDMVKEVYDQFKPLLDILDPFLNALGGGKQVIADFVTGGLTLLAAILTPVIGLLALAGMGVSGLVNVIRSNIQSVQDFYTEFKYLIDYLALGIAYVAAFKAAVAIGAAVAAAGGAMQIFTNGIAGILGVAGTLRAALTSLWALMMANPFTAIAAAVVLVLTNLDTLITFFETISAKFPAIMAPFQAALGLLKTLAALKDKVLGMLGFGKESADAGELPPDPGETGIPPQSPIPATQGGKAGHVAEGDSDDDLLDDLSMGSGQRASRRRKAASTGSLDRDAVITSAAAGLGAMGAAVNSMGSFLDFGRNPGANMGMALSSTMPPPPGMSGPITNDNRQFTYNQTFNNATPRTIADASSAARNCQPLSNPYGRRIG